MVATVRSRLNHYETLGVSPTADGDEIARAFARESSMFRPHAFGGLTEVCIAYETLRDPAKRRAYDASIGLKRDPSLPSFPVGARQALTAKGAVRAVPDRDVAASVPPQPKPAIPLGAAVESQATAKPHIGLGVSPRLSLEEELRAKVRPINWRRTGFALGGIVVTACGLGGLAGWWSASAIGETQPENAVSVPLPPAESVASTVSPQIDAVPVQTVPVPPPARAKPVATANVVAERTPPVAEPAAQEIVRPESSLAEQVAEEAVATPQVAAAMPLPNRVVARTIERIGYSCGNVTTSSPVEGEAPGVFKVTCSSGQSYQAKPVNGRYRFRRWGGR